MANLLSQLPKAKGSTKNRRRIGRGDGSGWGGTAAKGHKGQKARSGGGVPVGFEGGQMPLIRRLPKFGFTNAKFKTVYEIVTTGQIDGMSGDVTPETLKQAGLINKSDSRVKILTKGEITKTLNVKVHKLSQSAKSAIESAGGTVEVI